MAFDSSIRLRQLNQTELSGFLATLVQGYLSQTGNLTGVFYPLAQNPSGYEISGAFISQQDLDSAITQVLAGVSENSLENFASLNSANIFTATNNFDNTTQFLNSINFGTTLPGGRYSTPNINDYIGVITINPGLRALYNSNGTQVLNWQTQTLSGNWNVPIGGLSVSGNAVVTSNQTGNFGGGGNTGQLTGAFYPLMTNPLGYITSVSLTSYVTTGQTGSFITTGQTGNFYPANSNPSGYLTSGHLNLWDAGWGRSVTISCVSGILSVI